MQWIDIEHNSDEWWSARSGKLTASSMGKVMANYGKAMGDPAKKLAVSVAVARVTGRPSQESGFSSWHTERGHEQEPIARMAYEDERFIDVDPGGFYFDDRTGCSPDGLAGGDGLVEIKSVVAPTHYATMRRGKPDPAYKWQYYSQLMFSGRVWLDCISFCIDFPPGKQLVVHRIEASSLETEFEMMRTRIAQFNALVDQCVDNIQG